MTTKLVRCYTAVTPLVSGPVGQKVKSHPPLTVAVRAKIKYWTRLCTFITRGGLELLHYSSGTLPTPFH
jgi:hypothetical protein